MDPSRVGFDSGGVRRGGGPQMLLFGGGGSANSNGFIRGVPMAVLGRDDDAHVGKRPFFTTHEELMEEEYYDEQAPEKKRRLTPEQVQMLERSFEEDNKLEPERKTELARHLGMAPRQVAVWFQNRRARWKTKQLETDFDRLKAAYDALAADHQGLLADNDRLRAQVTSLTEKLQGKVMSPSATTTTEEVNHLDDHAAVSDAEKLLAQQLKESLGSGDCAVHGALSSEEEDGGVVSDEGCSFDFPDALFAAGAAEEAQLGSLASWFLN
ncbi:hypothetical protein PR202_gb03290 [Eleusine coracana subsp. coracana]|uniref:Homeobox-leucine zipper protein n=1 Tax=Eleusine coracana subsp. coracana TaxID=191504 RepID=A0AAV5DYW8_ELECO|nr:hypothetical protein QOZ80_8BG0659000 [Eleusine coracana subsp. coracana]GJN16244.1 hypothetical protein PR202_gb03209 [Eleusine coracana subsp. coracana]GJN16315.1 hypothetical protein PR202_gb03290 [Eleusine coracana subsp. coracana]